MEMCCDWWDLIFRFIMKRHQGSFVFHPKESHRSSSLHYHLRPPCWFSAVQLCLRKRLAKAGRQLLSEYFGRFIQGWGWLALVGCLSISLRKVEGRDGERREGGREGREGIKGRKDRGRVGFSQTPVWGHCTLSNIYIANVTWCKSDSIPYEIHQ